MQVLIPNALQPAEVEEVILCQMLGPGDRAGARGPALAGHRPPRPERPPGQQALRLGHRDHDPRGARRADRAGRGRLLRRWKASSRELAEKLVGEGFLSYDDLSVIEPDALMEMGGLTAEQADAIIAPGRGQGRGGREGGRRAAARCSASRTARKPPRRGGRSSRRPTASRPRNADGQPAEARPAATAAEPSAEPQPDRGRGARPTEPRSTRRRRRQRPNRPATATPPAAADEHEPRHEPAPVHRRPRAVRDDRRRRNETPLPGQPAIVERAVLPIRIYALAKELKIDNKKLVDICTKAGITGKGCAGQPDGRGSRG